MSSTSALGSDSSSASVQQQLQPPPAPAPAPLPNASINNDMDANQPHQQETTCTDDQVCVNCLQEISAEAAVAAFGQGRKTAVCVECMSSLMIQDKAARAKAASAAAKRSDRDDRDEIEGPSVPPAANSDAVDQQQQLQEDAMQDAHAAAWAVQIACRFQPNGCQFFGALGPLLNAHESKCIQRPVTCEHCEAKTTVGALPAHLESCKSYLIPCPLGCGAATSRDKCAGHDAECPNKMVECKYPGCKARMPRGFIPFHETDSKDHHLTLAYDRIRELQPCPPDSQCFARERIITGQFINYEQNSRTYLVRVLAVETHRIQVDLGNISTPYKRNPTWLDMSFLNKLSIPDPKLRS